MYGKTVFVNEDDRNQGNRTICNFKCLNCNALIKKEIRNTVAPLLRIIKQKNGALSVLVG